MIDEEMYFACAKCGMKFWYESPEHALEARIQHHEYSGMVNHTLEILTPRHTKAVVAGKDDLVRDAL